MFYVKLHCVSVIMIQSHYPTRVSITLGKYKLYTFSKVTCPGDEGRNFRGNELWYKCTSKTLIRTVDLNFKTGYRNDL